MSTASPSVSTTTAATAAAASAAASPYGGISSMHAAPQQPAPPAPQPQAPASHSGAPALHGHASTALACSDPHVGGHASSAGLYQQQPDSVNQSSHHMASSFPSTQLSPMNSTYAATYAAAHAPHVQCIVPGTRLCALSKLFRAYFALRNPPTTLPCCCHLRSRLSCPFYEQHDAPCRLQPTHSCTHTITPCTICCSYASVYDNYLG